MTPQPQRAETEDAASAYAEASPYALRASGDASADKPPGKDKPIRKVRIGNIYAAIWRNGNFYSASFERRYKDKDEQWQSSQSYGPGDLLALAKAADRAHDAILDLLKE